MTVLKNRKVEVLLMTKRTEKLILSVFEYCLRAAYIAMTEGILALEYLRLEKGLTDTGEILFHRKVDKFLAMMIGFTIDGAYSIEANQRLLQSLSRFSTRGTKTALTVASVCIDCIANGKKLEQIVAHVCTCVGIENASKYWDVCFEVQKQKSDNYEYTGLSEEQKARIAQTNIFFKMKEDECKRILEQKNNKLSKLHTKVPELNKHFTEVSLIYKPQGRSFDQTMYSISIPEISTWYYDKYKSPHFIGEIPVCSSMHAFWTEENWCYRDIKKLMHITDDIPNRLEKYLSIKTSMELKSEE